MKKALSYLLIVAIMMTFLPVQVWADEPAAQVPAFPGAEGGGKYTSGGRGQTVYEVTTLEDYGKGETPIPGSLRDAVSQSDRTIVFRVGGTIHLKESLKIFGSNLTLAGQTAPGDGITVSDYTTSIEADNIIIRYMRFRLGDRYASEDDAFGVRYHKNIIVDHCSFSWSVDEVVSLYDNVNTTVQWSISEESMLMTTHQKGRHGYGGIWGGNNTSFHHNLIAHSVSRNPRFPTDKRELDVVEASNNVIYNWGFASSYGGGEGYYNLDNNYYKPGPNTYDIVHNVLFGEIIPASKMYINGNIMDGDAKVTADNWAGVQSVLDPVSSKLAVRAEVANGFVPESAQSAYDHVLANVGATLPRRDAIDARVVNDVKNGTGQHINSPKEVGGFAEYPEVKSVIADNDHDGIDDAWELAHGLNPADPADGSGKTLSDEEGYTNLEVYLNELVTKGNENGANTDNPDVALTSPSNNAIYEAGGSLTIEAEASGSGDIAKVEFIVDGSKAGEAAAKPYRFELSGLADGTHYIVARAFDKKGLSTQSDNVTVHVNTTGPIAPWESRDIGSVGIPGHTQLEGDAKTLTVKSAGDIGGSADAFHYAYQKLSGNGEIIARVEHITPTDDNAEAGVMIRDSLAASSRMAMLSIPYVKMGKKGVMIHRLTDGGNTQRVEPDAFINTPYWIKLVRLGNQVTGSVSEDKENWSKIGTVTLDIGSEAYYGLAVDASKAVDRIDKYNASQFSGVEIRPLAEDFPAEPTGLKAEAGDNQAGLQWDAVEHAASYNVKRSDVSGGPYTVIAAGLTEAMYTDRPLTPGKAYYYVVSAVNANGESSNSSEVTVQPTGEPEPIYYVNEDFENEATDSTPANYEVSPSPQTETNKVVVANVPAESEGNDSAKALYLYDKSNVNTQFIRKFTPQYGTFIIDTDFMFPEESGTSVPLQVQSGDGSKTAFAIEVRKPVQPEASNSYTLTYNKGSGAYYKLMEPYSKNKWYNLKIVADTAADRADIYIDDAFVETFDFSTKGFKSYGIGRILSKTPGGGSGSFYFDNFKIYVEPVAAPKGLSALPGNQAVQLSWNAVQGADSYTIKRSETSGGPYAVIQTGVTGTAFIDSTVSNDTTYYYVVTANGINGETGNSNQVQATPSELAEKPAAPSGLTAISRNSQIDLSWNAMDNVNSYTVKRSPVKEGPYVAVAANITNPFYRVGGLSNQAAYYYVVSATNVGGEGPDSAPLQASAYEPPGTPSVTAQAGDGQIALSWPAVQGADGYDIKRSDAYEGPYTVIASRVQTTSYTDSHLTNGTPYYYKVAAVSADSAGMDSAAVAARPAGQYGQPSAPAAVQAEAGDKRVRLSWLPAEGASSYKVVRSENRTGPYTVAGDRITSGSFTDTGLTNGKAYYYAVAAVGESGESYASEPIQAVPATVIVVAQDGSGDFRTVAEAVNAVQDNSAVPTVIRIKDGIYQEKLYVPASKKLLTMSGESRDGTVIVFGDSAKTIGPDGKEVGTSGSYTLRASGTDFTLEHITIRNSAGQGAGQAVALYAEGDRGTYRDVKLLGYQDTLFADKGRQYFADSYIAGDVDFIFGNSPAVFENCILHSEGPGYVTAASSAEGQPGYVILNSTLTSQAGMTSQVELGRPWRPYSSVTYINTEMGGHIKPGGWNNWGAEANESTARYAEYLSKGAGANPDKRVTWAKQLTAAEAAGYTVQATLGGTDQWNPILSGGLPDSNSSLRSLTVQGEPLPQFDSQTRHYQVVLPEGTAAAPSVAAVSDSASANVSAAQAGSVPGAAVVTVTAADGTSSVYTIEFVLGSKPEPEQPEQPESGTGATGIETESAALTLEAGASVRVKATVLPETADQRVIWSGGSEAVRVTGDGLITGLKPGTAAATVTSVTYAVYSANVAVTVTDTTAPVWWNGALTAGAVTTSSAELNWTAAQDYVGVARYRIWLNGSEKASVGGDALSYTVAGLAAGTSYSFELTAEDAAGNRSEALTLPVQTAKIRRSSSGGSSGGGGGGASASDTGGTTPTDNGTETSTEGPVRLSADAMQVSTLSAGVVQVTVDTAQLSAAIQAAADRGGQTVELDMPSDASALRLVLPAGAAAAAASSVSIIVNAGFASYELPLSDIAKLKTAGAQQADIVLTMSQGDSKLTALAEEQAAKAGAKLLAPIVQFRITVDANGRSEELEGASVFAVHTIVLPGTVDDTIATGVIVDPATGQVRFVPAVFTTKNGMTTAKLLHPGNGVYTVVEAGKTFTDLKRHWAQKEIELLASKLVVQGTDADAFEPDRLVTRAEFASLLVRSLGLDRQNAGASFSDVKPGDWFAGDVNAAVSAGLVEGFEQGQFKPNDTITREQMAVMIARAAQFAGKPASGAADAQARAAYSDASGISGWAEQAVLWTVQAGIMQGTDAHTLAPSERTTRAQAAVMLKRLLQNLNFIN
ncbi:pectinesterase family protein [Paenibacillus doosanensis]|uniref:pectinesterase family protein n=1 Tax=Paenibacillus doosanensis TaxID=1229154 RepID=UPI00217F37B0|nr:pectinesterase family protein [Paenibacillus doosanensis]MCS7464380.1 pectinesterase family protein [Paenibacillus doosanensis]